MTKASDLVAPGTVGQALYERGNCCFQWCIPVEDQMSIRLIKESVKSISKSLVSEKYGE
jgi:hypothetical protein